MPVAELDIDKEDAEDEREPWREEVDEEGDIEERGGEALSGVVDGEFWGGEFTTSFLLPLRLCLILLYSSGVFTYYQRDVKRT